jgi:nitrogenase-stabilizing/protective protein
MTELTLAEDMEELSSAEEFLDYFGVDYNQKVVHVNRLHILQRFHDYIAQEKDALSAADAEKAVDEEKVKYETYKILLARAYQDFVDSDAATEKVFKVFNAQQSQTTFVPVDQIMES